MSGCQYTSLSRAHFPPRPCMERDGIDSFHPPVAPHLHRVHLLARTWTHIFPSRRIYLGREDTRNEEDTNPMPPMPHDRARGTCVPATAFTFAKHTACVPQWWGGGEGVCITTKLHFRHSSTPHTHCTSAVTPAVTAVTHTHAFPRPPPFPPPARAPLILLPFLSSSYLNNAFFFLPPHHTPSSFLSRCSQLPLSLSPSFPLPFLLSAFSLSFSFHVTQNLSLSLSLSPSRAPAHLVCLFASTRVPNLNLFASVP